MKQEGKDRRNAAKAANDAAALGISDAKDAYMEIDISNPFDDPANQINAYSGLDNQFAGLENKFAGAENVYEDQENVYAGAQNKFAGQKNAFEDMENAFEDLTVNTQQAEFEAQQNQQMQANIMSQMSGSAGGSGIAALAQPMANQGALQASKASASIGAQEAANKKAAAGAEQDIALKTAAEQSRLDTQKNQADTDIQNQIMGAEGAMQAAELGEQSRLNMAEMTAASDLQMAEAQGETQLQMAQAGAEMQMQSERGQAALQVTGMEMQRSENMLGQANLEMDRARSDEDKADAMYWAGQSQMTEGIGKIFNPLSDERTKEDIVKIRYSESGIPVYKFRYKGGTRTWIGTMAQDLIKLGRKDAVTMGDDGYYRVNYNLIDVDMEEISLPSPLKQMNPNQQKEGIDLKAAMDAGMDILSENQRRKNWETLQFMYTAYEPESMRIRKGKDRQLRENMRRVIEVEGGTMSLPTPFLDVNTKQLRMWQEEMVQALEENDKQLQKEIMMRLATLDQSNQIILSERMDFYEDHLEPESHLSKGVSKQQVSFATQIYCDNPRLIVTFATEEDLERGQRDYYDNIVNIGGQYAMVYDFYDRTVMIPVQEGNKDMFLINKLKILEYLNFLRETNQQAVEARKGAKAVKINLGRINYKIDQLFGYHDGDATKEQDELVLAFAHDDAILEDGSTFKRHLLEHPDLKNLNYGALDLDQFDQLDLPMGEGDKKNWKDNISALDRFKIVDAIINIDSPFFNKELIRRLVKEYYTVKLENAWWKGMGYDQGKLDIMRLKQEELIKVRFKRDKAEAMKEHRKEFTFDGKVYPTGLTDAKIAKMDKEKEEAVKASPAGKAMEQREQNTNQ